MYRDVTAASREAVRKRRERSSSRFAKGSPWGIMSLLNSENKCVLIFGLGRRRGTEGPVRRGHGHIGITPDPHEEGHDYRLSLLQFLTQQLAPEIRRLGESQQVAEAIRKNFTQDINPNDKKGPYMDVGSLTHIDATLAPEQEEAWAKLEEVGFTPDTEGAIDWREQTQSLNRSSFKTLEGDFVKLTGEVGMDTIP